MPAASRTGDPITGQIIQSSLQAAADEMFASLRKTAMSPIIYEVLDAATGIADAEGNLACSGAGIPGFVAVLDKAVKAILLKHPAETLRAGDVYVTNDPYYGGVTHLNDVVLCMPVFADGRLIAWTMNIAHWNDIGGAVPGSLSTVATDIFQEGLRLPAVKLIDQGRPSDAVMDIMRVNSRLPDFLSGDMWSAIASVRSGERRLAGLAQRYGADAFEAAVANEMDHAERISRRALASLPRGRFEMEEEQDDGSVYRVAVEIGADEFLVDLRDNPDQVRGPHNASRDGAMTSVEMAFKAVTDPGHGANAGSFRPVRMLTRPGSVFEAVEPAAVGFYFEVEIRLYDLLLRCLARHAPGLLPAGGFSSICGTFIGGPHPDTGRHATIVEPQVGGWGGNPDRDGNSAIFSGVHGETFNCPVEVAEARYGLTVDQLRLNDAPGGEGTFRGGKGIVLDYRVRADGSFLTAGYSRARIPPWGADGGLPGSPNYVEVRRRGGGAERHALVSNLRVDAGDVIRVVTGNGGGYGPPQGRPAEKVAEDVRDGYLTPERALEVYGWTADAKA